MTIAEELEARGEAKAEARLLPVIDEKDKRIAELEAMLAEGRRNNNESCEC